MKVSCPSCSAVLNIDDKKIPAGGARIKCPTCQNVFPVKPPAAMTVPLPGISAAPAQRQEWEDESTRVADMNIPSAAIPGATTVAAPPTNVRMPAARPPAVPLPGISAPAPQRQEWEEESTRVANVPLPGISAAAPQRQEWEDESTRVADVPLPGISAAAPQRQAWEDESTRLGTVPLPGAAGVDLDFGGAVPLPAGVHQATTAVNPAFTPAAARPPPMMPAAARTASVPLPGAAARTAAVPLPAASFSEAPTGSIPLPGADPFASDPDIDLGTSDDSLELDIAAPTADASGYDYSEAAPPPESALPTGFDFDAGADQADASGFDLAEAPAAPDPGGFDFSEAPPAPGGGFDYGEAPPAPAPGGFDFSEAPPAPAPGGFDFSEAPPAPAPGGFDFSEAPPAPAPGGFDYGEAPPAPGGFDFGAPPPPAPGNFDFGAPPPAAPPAPQGSPMGFGEVDFAAPGGGAAGGDLEFDPTSPAKPQDDLEADLSAPVPRPSGPSGPADGLEMLNFIDKTAREAGANPDELINVRRFHVKRRSGKVFGPFEEAVIAKMLEDGQLLGNEEISPDAEHWQPIGSEPALQEVVARLMEAPGRASTQMSMQAIEDAKGPSMDRLKALYEGRMAAVAVVQSKEPVPFAKRLPLYIAGVLIIAFVVGGAALGVATPYGFFGLKLLFPAKVRPDTREFAYLQQARKAILEDTWKSYREARDLANQALQIKEYPEARAIWSQAVFALDRKYGKADPAELEQAHAELVNIRLLGEKHPEVLKTEASSALSKNSPDAALASIDDAVARDSNDLESRFLRAEAYLAKRQPAQARSEYEAILKLEPKSAKALHSLGALQKSQNEFTEAATQFEAALAADPAHLASAVELAEISILRRREVQKGTALLAQPLSDEGRKTLSPGTLGKALALKAEALVVDGKLNEAVPLFEEALKADQANAFTNGRLAHAYFDLNQPEKAAPLYQVAQRAAPENLEYTEGYLSALILLGRMDEATKVMQSANARFPGNATLSYLSARVADVLDNPKEAEEAYKRAIAADAKIVDAHLFLSRLYMRFRRFQEAGPALEKGLEAAPDNASLRVGMGELALYERNLDRAETEFKKALELNPYSADANLGVARVAQERGKFELAAAMVEKALELNPRISGGRLQKGIALWKLGRLDEAIAELDAAREAEPKNTQIVVTLGAVKFEKGDLNGAQAHLNAALVAEPSHPDANFILAKLKNAKSEHTQAIEAMKRAIDYNGKNPLYRYWMGRILSDARKGDDAIAELKVALELEPKYAEAMEMMGRIYFDRNDFKRAVKYYQEALDAKPERNEVRALIGDAQMKMEDWTGAIMSYLSALDADPDLTQAYSRLGQAYQEKRQIPQAIEWYRKAVKVRDEDAEAWMALGYLYKDTKKKQDASTAFRKYLELKPKAENRREVEDELEYLK